MSLAAADGCHQPQTTQHHQSGSDGPATAASDLCGSTLPTGCDTCCHATLPRCRAQHGHRTRIGVAACRRTDAGSSFATRRRDSLLFVGLVSSVRFRLRLRLLFDALLGKPRIGRLRHRPLYAARLRADPPVHHGCPPSDSSGGNAFCPFVVRHACRLTARCRVQCREITHVSSTPRKRRRSLRCSAKASSIHSTTSVTRWR